MACIEEKSVQHPFLVQKRLLSENSEILEYWNVNVSSHIMAYSTCAFCKTFVKCFECQHKSFKEIDYELAIFKSSICVKVNKSKV